MTSTTHSRPLARLALAALFGWVASAPVHAGDVNPAAAPSAASASASQDLAKRLRTYWFDAARAGHLPMLREFMASGYPLNQRDDKGYTALILAAYHGHAEAVGLLMKAGADACAADARGNTALMGALFKARARCASPGGCWRRPATPTSATPPGRRPP